MIRNLKEISSYKVVDLFCGIGGLSYGFKDEGFLIAGGYDIDESCKYAYEKNNKSKFFSKDISYVTGEEINKLFGDAKVKVLVGCAPCQPFSSYTFKDKNKSNKKWPLLYQFLRIIEESKPQIISMENVAQLINFNRAPVFNDFVEGLKNLGYYVSYKIIYCPDYGIPQSRKRLVLLASNFGNIEIIPKTHDATNYVTVRDAIGDLPEINDGESHENDILHYSRKLNPMNKKRIVNTPYGGGWKDWPNELRLKCHKKESGKTYVSVYGRMKWDEPSPTITTHCIGYGNGRFGHPEQNRAISLREAALLQTFPKKYKFFKENDKLITATIARQLGNAVPVALGRVIAKSIKNHIKEYKNG